MAAISGTASAPQAFRGDASSRNEKSGNLTSCLLVGGLFFGHWRSDVTFPLIAGARHAGQSESTERQKVH